MLKNDKIVALKKEFPTIKIGSDETGYTEMNAAEYEATIAQWADVQLADEAKAAADKLAAEQAATDKSALLAKLGIDESDLKTLLS